MNRFLKTISLYGDLLFHFVLCGLMIAIAAVFLFSVFITPAENKAHFHRFCFCKDLLHQEMPMMELSFGSCPP